MIPGMIGRRPLALFAAGLVAVAGCASAPPEAKPRREITAPLAVGKTKTVVRLKVGDLVKLELPPVDLAGYGWQVFMHDSRYLHQKTEITPPATPGGRPTVSYLAIKQTPKTTVRFLLVKLDNAKETQPVDGHDVVFMIEPL
jgi:hypothetical protein